MTATLININISIHVKINTHGHSLTYEKINLAGLSNNKTIEKVQFSKYLGTIIDSVEVISENLSII